MDDYCEVGLRLLGDYEHLRDKRDLSPYHEMLSVMVLGLFWDHIRKCDLCQSTFDDFDPED